MTREQLEATIWAATGRQLTPKQVRIILDAAHAYATGDSEALRSARREILRREIDAAWGSGYGRRRGQAA